MKCPKCGHVRLATDKGPEYECPKCGIVYAKFDAAAQARLADQKARAQKPVAPAPAPVPNSQPASTERPPLTFVEWAPKVQMPYVVEEHLITIGGQTWQTKNITAVSIEVDTAKTIVPEPNFSKPKPRMSFHFLLGLILGAVTFIVGLELINGMVASIGGLFVGFACAWAIGHFQYKGQINEWTKKYQSHDRQHTRWTQLKSEKPKIYKLVFSSNNGQVTAVSSIHSKEVEHLRDVILQSMRSPSSQEVAGSIACVDVINLTKEFEVFCTEQMQLAARA